MNALRRLAVVAAVAVFVAVAAGCSGAARGRRRP